MRPRKNSRFGRKIVLLRIAASLVALAVFTQPFVIAPNVEAGNTSIQEIQAPPQPFLVGEGHAGMTGALLTMLTTLSGLTSGSGAEVAERPSPPPPAGSATRAELAALRLAPKNATGGTNLYSQNFGWGTSLVSLPGRSGLDLNLGISYNSLIWIKDAPHGEVVFDPDSNNVSPGFNLGLPRIEQGYQHPTTGEWRFLLVGSDGSRTEFRQIDELVFVSADSSYRQLEINDPGFLSEPNGLEAILSLTDGTRMRYVWINGAARCDQIKDRNGNYISITYHASGQINTMTDTLGRVITVNYDAGGYPSSITQPWRDNNGAGSNIIPRTWASFSYVNATVATVFTGLSVIGPANGSTVKVLDAITYPDGTKTQFAYNGYLQVVKVSTIAADSPTHVLKYTGTNLAHVYNTSQVDCPRFTASQLWAENFNVGPMGFAREVIVTNTAPTSATYSLPGNITGSSSRVDVGVRSHPNGLYTRIHFGAGGYKEGLTLATEDCSGSNCATRFRWTWNDWSQDNPNLGYILNPRVVEIRVGDTSNTKRTTIDYGANGYGLPELVKIYDTNLSTVLRMQRTSYQLTASYISRRIIGLPSQIEVFDNGDINTTPVSKVTYSYDQGAFTSTDPQQNVSPTQHDSAAYGTSFTTGRGNLTTVTRWNVDYLSSPTYAISSTSKYNTAGSLVSKTTPWDGTNSRTVKIDYTDNFNTTSNPTTYAYPTKVYDAAGYYSQVKYRYDSGANVWSKAPDLSATVAGPEQTKEYDSIGRILKETTVNSGAYTRHEYPTNGIQARVFSTAVDVDNDGPDGDDEVLSESWFDGAGRVRRTRTEHPGSVGGWTATQTEYDFLGRLYRTSVPTEVSVSGTTWSVAGDDAVRGWVWTSHQYDWKNREIRTVNSDGTDTLAVYRVWMCGRRSCHHEG